MMKVLGRSSSSNVQKVLWCAAELGLDIEHEPEYGGPFGNTDTPDYLAMNPNGLVPTFIEDDFILWESNAIVRYLGAAYGEGTLWPTDPKVRAQADKWMEWHSSGVGEASFPAFYELVRKSADERDQAVIDASVAAMNDVSVIMEAALADRNCFLGNEVTIADIVYGPTIHRWMTLPVDRKPRPNIARWYETMLKRPGYKKHVAIELS